MAGTTSKLAISRAGLVASQNCSGRDANSHSFPYAAEDHQTYNAAVFTAAGGSVSQAELTPQLLESKVLVVALTSTVGTNALTSWGDRSSDSAERLPLWCVNYNGKTHQECS